MRAGEQIAGHNREEGVIEPQELIRLLRSGNPDAPRIFLDDYGDFLNAVLHRRFDVSADVHDDLMQVVMLHLVDNDWRVLSLWSGQSSFKAYLVTVAANKCRDHLRREYRHRHDDDIDVRADDSAYESSTQHEIKTMVENVLDTLGLDNSNCRKLLLLKYLHDFSYREISELMDYTVNQVGVYLKRCLDKCRSILGMDSPFDDEHGGVGS